MKKYVLLSADNVGTNIDGEVFPSYDEAYGEMKDQWESAKEEEGVEEADIDKNGASVYMANNDLFYWKIKKIEV